MFSPLQRTKSAENVKATRNLSELCQEKRPKTVAELMIQIEGEGIRTKSKPKIEVRNFARENVLRLREIQRACRQTKESRNVPVKPEYKPNQLRENRSSLSTYNQKTASLPSSKYGQSSASEIKPIRINQTVDRRKPQNIPLAHKTTRSNDISAVGKKALPSAGRQQPKESADEADLASGVSSADPLSIPHLPLHKPEQIKLQPSELLNKSKDHLQASKVEKATERRRPQLRRSSSLSCILPAKNESSKNNLKLPSKYQLGVVPKYLHERQKQWKDEEERRKREAPDPDVPPGLELLPDAERISTLSQLDQSYNELLKQMLMLPVRMDTLRIRQQKERIEKEMVKIEEAIKIFSQPKVFIKKDE